MIEPTEEMAIALLRAMPFADREMRKPEDVLPWVAAVLPIVEQALIARVEGERDTGLCDCGCDNDPPISPKTGAPMEHHCDCKAVTTAGVLLGDRRRTKHVAECVCNWDTDIESTS